MVEIKVQSGFIAFFDILGYQQMLLNYEMENTAHLIVDVLANIPNEVVKNITEDQGLIDTEHYQTRRFQDELWTKIVNEEVKWLLFSDSILISLPFDPERGGVEGMKWIAFLYVCAFLQRNMFDRGLPLRGSISFGEFFIQDTYFAGRPIIESYQSSESLELSGCVLTNSTAKLFLEFKKFLTDNGFDSVSSTLNQICVPYLVPKKNNKLENQFMVNWVNLPMTFFGNLPPDIREYVFSSFVEYNKAAAPIVYGKINNTETFIRYILTNVESKPWPVMTEKMDAYYQQYLKEHNIQI